MDPRKAAGAFALVTGVLILGAWSVLLATRSVPELRTERTQFLFLLSAELITVELLVVAAAGLMNGLRWGEKAYLFATGMLTYGILHNTGVMVQAGALGAATVEAAMGAAAIVVLAAALRKTPRNGAPPTARPPWKPAPSE